MIGLRVYSQEDWRLISKPQVNVDGVWLHCKRIFVLQGGCWCLVHGRVAEIIPFPTPRKWPEGVHDVCISAA